MSPLTVNDCEPDSDSRNTTAPRVSRHPSTDRFAHVNDARVRYGDDDEDDGG